MANEHTTPIHIDRDIHRKIKVAASERGLSIKDYLEHLIERHFKGRNQ